MMNRGLFSKKAFEFRYQDETTGETHTQQIDAIGIELAEQAMMDWLIEPGRDHYTYLSGPSLCANQEVQEHA